MENFALIVAEISRRTISVFVVFWILNGGSDEGGVVERISLSKQTTGVSWNIPQLSTARQLVCSITATYDSSSAMVQLFERNTAYSSWRALSQPFPAVTGRAGLGWGIGLHGDAPTGAPIKREGDGRAPAGVFVFKEAFGSLSQAALGHLQLFYCQMTQFHYGVDDPSSHFYNKIVDIREVTRDWASAEKMLRDDGLYRLGIVVGHNVNDLPGRGSCIFLHVWRGPEWPTVGCTAFAYKWMFYLECWLDPEKQPLLIQLPFNVYQSLRESYALPVVPNPSAG
jgi:L,D-peptidoglycan transpeptidase YkuD (ErfK/YbiS/YcfS/YnhG family)